MAIKLEQLKKGIKKIKDNGKKQDVTYLFMKF
jgi:hypothetical protein